MAKGDVHDQNGPRKKVYLFTSPLSHLSLNPSPTHLPLSTTSRKPPKCIPSSSSSPPSPSSPPSRAPPTSTPTRSTTSTTPAPSTSPSTPRPPKAAPSPPSSASTRARTSSSSRRTTPTTAPRPRASAVPPPACACRRSLIGSIVIGGIRLFVFPRRRRRFCRRIRRNGKGARRMVQATVAWMIRRAREGFSTRMCKRLWVSRGEWRSWIPILRAARLVMGLVARLVGVPGAAALAVADQSRLRTLFVEGVRLLLWLFWDLLPWLFCSVILLLCGKSDLFRVHRDLSPCVLVLFHHMRSVFQLLSC
ncbi:hypothetical protein QBC34DRAFT_413413 [Podospora aff. communis PSN243]|uniref:Uncharacterized protein n=1 Tax=Podospora aff. communis PSN243 TaxID=3040156 RepID=A0AAV9GAE3_9PEZI|nr:hypothetical protein QBC34DRAFT_413413 [Podospora aff. communis PSN243]